MKRKPLKKLHLFAWLGAIVAAIAFGTAQPVSADQTVAQAPAAAPSASPTPAPKALQVSGYADAGYTSATFALHNSPTPPTIANSIVNFNGTPPYVFDTLNQQIQFHTFNLQAAYTGPVGGKIEANFGDDANLINSYPKSQLDVPFTTGPEIDITQAYLSFRSGQFTGIVGKFETLAGAEVIESPNDYDISRSILFGYAVPRTLAGGRLTWSPKSAYSLIVGLNKGWNLTSDLANPYNQANFPVPDNGALTVEAGAAWNPSKAFSAKVQGYTGTIEQGNTVVVGPNNPLAVANPFAVNGFDPSTTVQRSNKSLIDTVLTLRYNSALTFVLNGDWGKQTNTNIFATTTTIFPGGYSQTPGTLVGYGTATWSGLAGYVNYAFNPRWSASGRLEYLADYGGAVTGNTQRWGEGTLTLQYAPNSNVLIRGEIRGHLSNQLLFLNQIGSGVSATYPLYHQNAQFGIEAIVKWP
jgi:hypothetical protein